VELRNPNKSHYPLILELLNRSFQPAWPAQAVADKIYYEPHYDPSHVWMAREEGKVLGFLVTTLYEDKAWLKLLVVAPEARRQGLGRDMLSRAEYRLSGEGAKSMHVEGTPPFEFLPGVAPNSEADLFFRSQGYRATPVQVTWVPPHVGPQPEVLGFERKAAATFAHAHAGKAWPWVEETLGSHPPRMVFEEGRGLCLAEPGVSIGPLWMDSGADNGADKRLIVRARGLAGEACADPRGLRFWQLPGSAPWPPDMPSTVQDFFSFSKTLA